MRGCGNESKCNTSHSRGIGGAAQPSAASRARSAVTLAELRKTRQKGATATRKFSEGSGIDFSRENTKRYERKSRTPQPWYTAATGFTCVVRSASFDCGVGIILQFRDDSIHYHCIRRMAHGDVSKRSKRTISASTTKLPLYPVPIRLLPKSQALCQSLFPSSKPVEVWQSSGELHSRLRPQRPLSAPTVFKALIKLRVCDSALLPTCSYQNVNQVGAGAHANLKTLPGGR